MDTTDNKDKLYYTIGEVAKIFGINQSTIRYWETEFGFYLKPKRNKKGNRVFTRDDIEKIRTIHHLVKEQGMKLDAAKKVLKTKRKELETKVEVVKRLKNIREMLVKIKERI